MLLKVISGYIAKLCLGIATLTPKDIAEKSHILMTQYTLSAEQKDYILSDTTIFNEFIRVHAIIENMIERSKPPKDRTKYLAKSLGLDKVIQALQKLDTVQFTLPIEIKESLLKQ